MRYVDDGELEIGSSTADRVLRRVVPKELSLHGAHSEDRYAALLNSLIGRAELKGFGFGHYLLTALAHTAEYPINRITELPPWSFATSLQRALHGLLRH